MADQIHIQIYYAPSVEAPERFFELRHCANDVWTAEGGIYTHGESSLVAFGAPDETARFIAQVISEKTTEGFTLARSLSYAPDGFDYAAFTSEVTRGLEVFWRNLGIRHPSVKFDRLAISTDADVMTISAIAHQGESDDEDYILYNPQEWAHYDANELEIAYRLMLSKHRGIPFEKQPPNYDDSLLECMIRALEAVRSRSLFPEALLLWIDISDSAQIAGMYKRLNTKENARKLSDFIGDASRRLRAEF